MPKAKQESLIEEPGQGHNSLDKKELMKIIEHVEGLLDERANVSGAIKDALDVGEAKGFDKKMIKEMTKVRKMDATVREEAENLRDLYLVTIGLA